MSTMRILIPDAIFPGEATIEQSVCPPGVEIDLRRGTTPADIPDDVWRSCTAIVIWQVMDLRAETIAKLDNCRIIARAGVGFDGIDLAAAAQKGIPVCNCPDYGTTDVADHAIALYLALSRGILAYVPKPFDLLQLEHLVSLAVSTRTDTSRPA